MIYGFITFNIIYIMRTNIESIMRTNIESGRIELFMAVISSAYS